MKKLALYVCVLFIAVGVNAVVAAPLPTGGHAGLDVHLHTGFQSIGPASGATPFFAGTDNTNNPAQGWHFEIELRNPGADFNFFLQFRAGGFVRQGILTITQFERKNFDFHIPDQGGELGGFLSSVGFSAGFAPADLEFDIAVTEPPPAPSTTDVVPTFGWLEIEDTGQGFYVFQIVPEPSTALLLSLGLVGLAAKRRR